MAWETTVTPYSVAKGYTGSREGDDALDDFLNNGGRGLSSSQYAWCARFVKQAAARAGVDVSAMTDMARSALNIGKPVDKPNVGDVVVLSRTRDPTYGHVGFYEGHNPDGSIRVLGGNQNSSVSVSSFPATRVLGFRRLEGDPASGGFAPPMSLGGPKEAPAPGIAPIHQTNFGREVRALPPPATSQPAAPRPSLPRVQSADWQETGLGLAPVWPTGGSALQGLFGFADGGSVWPTDDGSADDAENYFDFGLWDKTSQPLVRRGLPLETGPEIDQESEKRLLGPLSAITRGVRGMDVMTGLVNSFLPFGQYEDGSIAPAWPAVLADPYEAAVRGLEGPDAVRPEDALIAAGGAALGGIPFAKPNSVGIFGGRLARTADHAALAKAEEMAAQGVPREQIWSDTGWFKGVDGKWRFEIDDSKSYLDLQAAIDDGLKPDQRWPLDHVLGHKKLYDAYPDLSSAGFRFKDFPDGYDSAAGSYVADSNDFVLNSRYRNFGKDDDMGSFVLHEAQHATQNKEGFARGGNDRMFSADEIAAERARLANQDEGSGWSSVGTASGDMPDRDVGRILYRRLAGETEARTVQERLNMTADERRARPPWLDYDVPEADQIVRLFSNPKEAALAPAAVNALTDQGAVGSAGGRLMQGAGSNNPKVRAAQKRAQSVPFDDKLVVQHNMRNRSLNHNMNKYDGNIPVPSLAVSKAGQPLTNFGEISLFGKPDLAIPSGSNPVYPADAYTKRAPRIVRDIPRIADKDRVYEKLTGEKGAGYKLNLDDPYWDEGFRLGYLRAQGKSPPDGVSPYDWSRNAISYDERPRFESWVDDFLQSHDGLIRERIDRGWSNDGERRLYSPHTLDNMVKASKGKAGSEDWDYGPNAWRAHTMSPFRSLAEIQESRGLIGRVDKTEMDAIKNAATEKGFALANALGYRDTDPGMIMEGLRHSDPAVRAMARELADDLKKLPTEYFEAKPQRAVDIAEFSLAAVPEGMDDAVRNLKSKGLDVRTYDRSKIGEVGEPLSDILRTRPDLLFSNPKEAALAPAAVNALTDGGADLPMDLASRMARAREMGFDTDRVLYHGTNRELSEFDPEFFGASTGTGDLTDGVWTTRDFAQADLYGRMAAAHAQGSDFDLSKIGNYKSEVMRLYGPKENDLFVYDAGAEAQRLIDEGYGETFNDVMGDLSAWLPQVIKEARNSGKKGLRVLGIVDDPLGGYGYARPTDQTLLFDPSRIRSVNAAFDPAKADSANLLAANPKEAALSTSIINALEDQAPKGIRAYHGSPHDFDRFSLDKIGTGEGAQAYGHGLYFAENENVAKSYKQAEATLQGPKSYAQMYLDRSGGNRDEAIAALKNEASLASPGNSWSDHAMAAKLLENGWSKPSGKMYEVNIKADPDQFLDWDLPLSQQSEAVRNAFSDVLQAPDIPGQLAYYRKAGDLTGTKSISSPEVAAALREAGIPGIRYLDQGSRAAGKGSRNYVVFDDNLIDILRKYANAPTGAPFALAGDEFDPEHTKRMLDLIMFGEEVY